MEQHRDEQMHCADCGAAFVFSAAEATVFAERGLIAPKRCKACRQARKQQAANGLGAGHLRGGNVRGGQPRYTGDVNEYRSPMQDNSGPAQHAPHARQARRTVGEYRSPMPDRGTPRPDTLAEGRGPRRPRSTGGQRPPPAPFAANGRRDGGDAPRAKASGDAPRMQHRRPPAPKFPITCDACGAESEVPFQPAEGREVYCAACYKARRVPKTEAAG